jgi:predicted lipoprotein with Yx(FWY)xxD motif
VTNRTSTARRWAAWTSIRAVRVSALVSAIGLLTIGTALATTTTTVRSTNSPRYGTMVVNASKHTLYVWCYGTQSTCPRTHRATNWPPLLAIGRVVTTRHSGINPRKLGTRRLRNGKKQVTYYGQPLYTYKGDRKRCQANGEDKTSGSGTFTVLDTNGRPAPTPCYIGEPPSECPPVCG